MRPQVQKVKLRAFVLLGAGLAGSSAIANWLWFWHASGGGRVREAGLFAYLGYFHSIGSDPSAWLPAPVHVFRELGRFGDWLASVCWPVSANLVGGALLGACVWLLARRLAVPALALVFVVALAPAFLPPAEDTIVALIDPAVRLELGSFSAAGGRVLAYFFSGGAALLALFVLRRRFRREGLPASLGRSARVTVTVAIAVFTLATLAASYRGLAVAGALPPPPGSPNILLISIDALRPDRLGCYGHSRETSPTIDRLAREGAVFETAISPSSWTLPAHLTLLTSLNPLEHGVVSADRRLSAETVTLAESFRSAGYKTAGFAAAPFVNARYGFRQGFEWYDDYTVGSMVNGANLTDVTSPASFAAVSAWLEGWRAQRSPRPFFVFLHLWDVHDDYAPPPPYDSMFDPDYSGDVDSTSLFNSAKIHAGMAPRDLEHIQALYDGEIRWVDDHLASLVDRLEQWGELDDTLVVITSDHGDEFFEHGDKGHRTSLYDELVRVPLVMRYPSRIPAGLRIYDPVRLVDVGPTLLSLANAPPPPGFAAGFSRFPARDLTPWFALGGKPLGEDDAAAILDLNRGPDRPRFTAIRTRNRKLILDLHRPSHVELYDLAADPGETNNLALRTERDNELREILLEAHERSRTGAAARAVGAGSGGVDALRSLGYIQ